MENILRNLGFLENEAKVYLALLEIGETATGKIIKKTGLHRNIVYTELERLVSKKLAMKFKKRKKLYFAPLSPERLLEDFNKKKEILEKNLPSLINLYKKQPSEIVIYEGKESYRDFWLTAIRTYPKNSINYIGGSIGKRWWEIIGDSYSEYDKYRRERKIKWKMIVYSREELEIRELKRNPKLTEIRMIPYKIENLGNFNVWDKSLILQSAEPPPILIEIRNEALVKVFKQYFDFLWKLAKPIKISKIKIK